MIDQETSQQWRCARCTVTASWTEGARQHKLPTGWIEQNGVITCLSCRQRLAGEAGEAALNGDATDASRDLAAATARVEFEVNRDPNRGDTKIARAARSSAPAVRKIRDRLGIYPTGPS